MADNSHHHQCNEKQNTIPQIDAHIHSRRIHTLLFIGWALSRSETSGSERNEQHDGQHADEDQNRRADTGTDVQSRDGPAVSRQIFFRKAGL
jgi:hypothetical protein